MRKMRAMNLRSEGGRESEKAAHDIVILSTRHDAKDCCANYPLGVDEVVAIIDNMEHLLNRRQGFGGQRERKSC